MCFLFWFPPKKQLFPQQKVLESQDHRQIEQQNIRAAKLQPLPQYLHKLKKAFSVSCSHLFNSLLMVQKMYSTVSVLSPCLWGDAYTRIHTFFLQCIWSLSFSPTCVYSSSSDSLSFPPPPPGQYEEKPERMPLQLKHVHWCMHRMQQFLFHSFHRGSIKKTRQVKHALQYVELMNGVLGNSST